MDVALAAGLHVLVVRHLLEVLLDLVHGAEPLDAALRTAHRQRSETIILEAKSGRISEI